MYSEVRSLQSLSLESQAYLMFDRVADASPEYCRLRFEHLQQVAAHGFAYLNSANSHALLSVIHEVERTTIEKLGDRKLIELYDLWNTANELRERAMLNNIESFSRQASFSRGVFLVGAEHAQSISDLIRRQ